MSESKCFPVGSTIGLEHDHPMAVMRVGLPRGAISRPSRNIHGCRIQGRNIQGRNIQGGGTRSVKHRCLKAAGGPPQ